MLILLNSGQEVVLAPSSYVKARISGTNKYSSPMFHYEGPF